MHKFSIGYQRTFAGNWTASTDYVHTRGSDEGRVQVINPQIRSVCDPAFSGSTPSDARCVGGASTRYFDAAFVRAGLGAGRLGQINMIGTTNESKFDSWTTTLRARTRRAMFSLSYVLANSRAWGGQPTASYSGNGIAITPEHQFRDSEWGPTRLDERYRVVASGVIDLPFGLQVSPIVQFASARPYTPVAGFDINGDGLTNIVDRLCDGVGVDRVFAVRGDLTAIRALNPNGCNPAPVNSQRKGFVVNADGSVEERAGNFLNADLRVTKGFTFGRRTRSRFMRTCSTSSTPKICRSHCGRNRAPRMWRVPSCSRCRSTGPASDRRSDVLSRHRSGRGSSSDRSRRPIDAARSRRNPRSCSGGAGTAPSPQSPQLVDPAGQTSAGQTGHFVCFYYNGRVV